MNCKQTPMLLLDRQVGTSPLRELVRDAVSMIERYYIQEALMLTRGNRSAAAEMLGLSRQSLYSKVDLYGVDLQFGALQGAD